MAQGHLIVQFVDPNDVGTGIFLKGRLKGGKTQHFWKATKGA